MPPPEPQVLQQLQDITVEQGSEDFTLLEKEIELLEWKINEQFGEIEPDSEKRKKVLLALYILIFLLGFTGNFLYYKWSIWFVDRRLGFLDLTEDEKNFLKFLFIMGNGITNGFLTTIPLQNCAKEITDKRSKEEQAILGSEIPFKKRLMYFTFGLIASVCGQIAPAWYVILALKNPAFAALLIGSHTGFTWWSVYKMCCAAYVARTLTLEDKTIATYKPGYNDYLEMMAFLMIQYRRDNTQLDDDTNQMLGILIHALGKPNKANVARNNINFKKALSAFYNIAEREIPKSSLTRIENGVLHAISALLLAYLLMLYWYGGGNAGKAMFHDSEVAFYFFALISMGGVAYLSHDYIHTCISGIWLGLKNLLNGYRVPGLAEACYPKATWAWYIFSAVMTFFALGFGWEQIFVIFPEDLQNSSLAFITAALICLLGYGMFSITDPIICKFMEFLGYQNAEIQELMTAHGMITKEMALINKSSPRFFAQYIDRVFELFQFEERFGITLSQIKKYLDSNNNTQESLPPSPILAGSASGSIVVPLFKGTERASSDQQEDSSQKSWYSNWFKKFW